MTKLFISVFAGLAGGVVGILLTWGYATANVAAVVIGAVVFVVLASWFGWGLWSTREVSARHLRRHPARRQ